MYRAESRVRPGGKRSRKEGGFAEINALARDHQRRRLVIFETIEGNKGGRRTFRKRRVEQMAVPVRTCNTSRSYLDLMTTPTDAEPRRNYKICLLVLRDGFLRKLFINTQALLLSVRY